MFLSMRPFDDHNILAFSLLLCIMISSGCVKEDREECPCRLIVDLSEVDTSRISSVNIMLAGYGGLVYEGQRYAESYLMDDVISVPRDHLFLNVSYGDDNMMTADGLRIPEGEGCPPVYLYSAFVDASDREFVRKSVDMCKSHCVMTIYVEGDGDDFPFDMLIKGNVCGYDGAGHPSPGGFCCAPEMIGESVFRVVLPRQTDASLFLEVNDGTDVVKRFALGEYVKACGYDWTEPDLKDITVGVDYSRTMITVAVQGWDQVYEFDIVI